MASSKNWALFASKHRLGKMSEHQLSGARIMQVSVGLKWTVMHGWVAEFTAYRFSVRIGLATSRNDPRWKEWIALMFQDAVKDRLQESFDEENG